MGAAQTAIAVATALAATLAPSAARADDPAACVWRDKHGPYSVCFDLGNQLAVGVGTDGVGGEIAVRHMVRTAEPGIYWMFEHHAARGGYGWGGAWRATVYEGRFLRHSRDGFITLPTSPPRRLSFPLDVGAEFSVGEFRGRAAEDAFEVTVVRAAALFDLARWGDFQRRLTIAPVVRWDAVTQVTAIDDVESVDIQEHRVAPFSVGALEGYLEARNGLTRARAIVEGGVAWSDVNGWERALRAEASLERVVLSVNDRPFSIYLQAAYDDQARDFSASAGLRVAVLGSRPISTTIRRQDKSKSRLVQ